MSVTVTTGTLRSRVTANARFRYVAPPPKWTAVTTAGAHTCAVRSDSTLWCWGSNYQGLLGVAGLSTGPASYSVTPRKLAGTGWKSVDAGETHTCAVKSDQSLWCWGYGDGGRLGQGDAFARALPAKVAGTWLDVGVGNDSTCAVRTDRTMACWGNNTDEAFGNGNTGGAAIPVPAANGTGGWSTVAIGSTTTCARKTGGGLWCWGRNVSGQVGDGTAGPDVSHPVAVGTGWTAASTGLRHTCALGGGALTCWGGNTDGELGVTADDPELDHVAGPAGTWISFSAGFARSCAVKSGGTLWCWGDNTSGQLGTCGGDTLAPAQVGGSGWLRVDTYDDGLTDYAYGHTCAVRTDGTLWCWGNNDSAQVGAAPSLPVPTPRRVTTG